MLVEARVIRSRVVCEECEGGIDPGMLAVRVDTLANNAWYHWVCFREAQAVELGLGLEMRIRTVAEGVWGFPDALDDSVLVVPRRYSHVDRDVRVRSDESDNWHEVVDTVRRTNNHE